VRTGEAGRALADSMGQSAACLILGHGLVTVGDDPVQAVLRTLAVDELARVAVQVAALGGDPGDVPEEDLVDLPDLGAAFNEGALWRHHLGRLDLRGLADVG
ncbi:MAG: hypothetical protein JWR35_3768, partial [Marmoricola sp.]|nr:hypothetical protein [Marmoricola sp.]